MNGTKVFQGFRPGVVLAAGLGSRLVESTGSHNLKPLVPVDGIALLLRTLQSLEICCRRVVIVLGYGADRIRDTILSKYCGPLKLQFVVNERYLLANGVSVLAARQYIEGDFILTMADHIIDAVLLERARDYKLQAESAALLVDYKLETIYDMADATKVCEKEGKIVAIGKELAVYNCVDTGVFVCTGALMDALNRVFVDRGDVSLSEGVQWLASYGRMFTIDIIDGFWQDVDTPEMLAYAEKILSFRGSSCDLLKN